MEKKTMDTVTDREAVKKYLQQYHVAKNKKHILEDRHRVLAEELKSPAPGSRFRTVPASRPVNPDGSVSVVFRIAEVEERIDDQREEMAKAVLHVMDMIDLLPQNSMERTVVELRHIDCKSWEQIAREVYMSRSAVFNYYNAALERLMKYKRTRKLVEDYVEDG
jgi:Sigma-70, region 4.